MSREWRPGGSVTLDVAAPPDAIYAVIADVERIGERSPECRSAAWLPGSPPGVVGSRFRGCNRSRFLARWSRTCEVLDAVPGETFVFRTMPARDPSRHDSTTWSYRLRPSADRAGTEVTHSYEITLMPGRVFKAIYGVWLPQHRDMRPQMLESLQNLKRSLE